jgi:hypothetical protein
LRCPHLLRMRSYSALAFFGISSIGGSIPLLRSQSRKARPVPLGQALHSCNGTWRKSSSSSLSAIVPCAIVSQHDHALVLNHRRDNRRWIVIVNETALSGAHGAHFAPYRAID